MTVREIIEGCINDDRVCQKQLVQKYSSLLMTVARRYAPNTYGPSDLLQDSFIKIFGAIKTYDAEKGSIETWMRRIVINTALKKLKRKYIANEVYTLDNIKPIYSEPKVYEKFHEEEIMELIEGLPEGYRQVFNLYVIEGYSHKEIGNLLQIEESSSRSNLSRARIILRKKIMQEKKQEIWAKIV
jgi:RNA polymerase sigma-70 factor (ECF subfamily)